MDVADLTPHLHPGERVLWSQQGPALRLALPVLIPLGFAITWTTAALGFVGLVVWSMVREGLNGWAGLIIASVMAAGGAWFTAHCWRGFLAGFSTLYAVTDRAALILEAPGRPRLRRFDAATIAGRRIWGDRIGFRPDITDANAFDSTTSFIGVRDMAHVEDLLSRAAQGRAP